VTNDTRVRRVGAGLERLAQARRLAFLKIAGAVVIVGGLFAILGLGDTLTGQGFNQSNWGAAGGAILFFVMLGAIAAAVVEIRFRARRRRFLRR
jgi:hypothetical protein